MLLILVFKLYILDIVTVHNWWILDVPKSSLTFKLDFEFARRALQLTPPHRELLGCSCATKR